MHRLVIFPFLSVALTGLGSAQRPGSPFQAHVPRVWDDRAMADLEIPLARAEYSPKHVTANYYYRIPVRPIYVSYPVYHPDREPANYVDWMRRQQPQLAWDRPRLETKEDWIRAGELVFDAPLIYGAIGFRDASEEALYVRDRAWHKAVRAPITSAGILPAYRYVVREQGKIEIGVLACAMCHTRVMPDGTAIRGAQGNFPFDAAFGETLRSASAMAPFNRKLLRLLYFTPWVPSNLDRVERMQPEEMAALFAGRPGGTLSRHRSALFAPLQVPDLIGVEHRRYLDHSGLQPHRGVEDLMRYAALNQGMDDLSDYGGFIPFTELSGGRRPEPEADPELLNRYSDEQLYALALYIYSLRPPPNPNRFDGVAAAGKRVFEREGCPVCHTPPLYTNNKLTPASGFHVPSEHKKKYDILPVSVGTDTRATMETRRGTGYYKVPSLLGVWYRGPFEHNGSVMTLEDWFNPQRLRNDYVPTGFKGLGVKMRAVRGHEFGLHLSDRDKRDLLAFLRTL
jgi:hypothetical protein